MQDERCQRSRIGLSQAWYMALFLIHHSNRHCPLSVPSPCDVSNPRYSGLLQRGLLSQVWSKWRAMLPTVLHYLSTLASWLLRMQQYHAVCTQCSLDGPLATFGVKWYLLETRVDQREKNQIEIEFCPKKSNWNQSKSDNHNHKITRIYLSAIRFYSPEFSVLTVIAFDLFVCRNWL